MSSEPLLLERHGAVLLATINRPASGNAISSEVVSQLQTCVDALDADVRVLVITGAGDKFFAAGGDIKQYRALQTRAELAAAFAKPRQLLDALEALPIPVIAAVNGYALGGGAELLLATDLRIAAPHAEIGFPYARLSLIAGWYGLERLLRDCGYARAMELLLTGTAVNADEAVGLGLVGRVCHGESVVEAALTLAEQIVALAPLSAMATKRAMRAAVTLPQSEARGIADALFARLWMSDDHREAEAAFAEKRTPTFKGSP